MGLTLQYVYADGFHLLDRERPLLKFMQRDPWAEFSPATRDWLWCQATLNRLLSQLLNGDAPLRRRKLSDWIYRYCSAHLSRWRGSWPSPGSTRLAQVSDCGRVSARRLFDLFCEAESFLLEPPTEISTQKLRYSIECQSRSTHPVIPRLRSILAPIGQAVTVCVHGSVAFGDYTEFSDIDDFVVVHREAWKSFEIFCEVAQRSEASARLFQRIDPLQHHGHWVFSEFDLACLEQSTMPLVVLNGAVSITGRSEIQASVRVSVADRCRILWWIIQETRSELSTLMAGNSNLFGLKNLIGAISLLPALVFQITGEELDKKNAIARSHERFSPAAGEAISWATSVRTAWKHCIGYSGISQLRALNSVLPCRRVVMEQIARRLSSHLAGQDVQGLDDRMVRAISRLSDESAQYMLSAVVPAP